MHRRILKLEQQEILKKISIINVKNKLKLEEVFSKKDIIYVKCPFCNLKKGTMKLNIANNSYICKDCEARGYAIGLYAKCNYISNKEAYQRLINSEADISNNLTTSTITNTKKNDEELDIVYQAFLDSLILDSNHTMKLLQYGFSIEEIDRIGFKTIPTKDSQKVEICRKLIEKGFDLEGVPGFFIDKKFRWNFKSHEGIFIPIFQNCKLVALRIHLDKKYNTDTTDIWFSSSQDNNGTKQNNNIMIIYPENNRIQIMNDNQENKDIIVVSEMILAYKMASRFKNNIIIRCAKCYFKK